MARGLPRFSDVLNRPSGSDKADTRDLRPPRNLKKVRIESLDIPFRTDVTELLLNPDAISESKAANWIQQQVPGQSDPLLQWVNGNERVVTFTALVTRDVAQNPTLTQTTRTERVTFIEGDEASAGLEIVNGISSTTANILSGLARPDIIRGPADEVRTRTWIKSIQSNLDYYRSLLAPRKSSRKFQLKAPPLVRLEMGDILGSEQVVKRQRWVMLSYDFNITKFTPQLEPMEAQVTFTFIEYVDRSKTVDAASINRQLDRNSAKGATITNVEVDTIPRDAINQNLDRF